MGATPRQTVISFVVAQFGVSLFGCAAGIPLGVLLFNTVISNNVKDMATITLPVSVYVAVAVAVPLLYLLVAIVPAGPAAGGTGAGLRISPHAELAIWGCQ